MDDINLTNSEWYVLDCLWEKSPMTVMELVAALGERLGWAKSTTITTLRRMEDKGLVRCAVEGRAKHYAPNLPRDRAVRITILAQYLFYHRKPKPQALQRLYPPCQQKL